MLGCFNPILGKIWTNPAIGLHFLIKFLTQWLFFFHILAQHFLELAVWKKSIKIY